MKTLELKLYTFDELSEEAKEKAIEDNRTINVEYDWWDCEFDVFKGLGIIVNAFDIYRKTIVIKLNGDDCNEVAYNIMHEFSGNDIYELSLQYSIDFNNLKKKYNVDDMMFTKDETLQDEFDDELELLDNEYKKDLGECILSWLEREYYYLMEDDVVAETLEINEYEFLENGNKFNQ